MILLQGLYAMSINCMEAAEAQFKTALMVISSFSAVVINSLYWQQLLNMSVL